MTLLRAVDVALAFGSRTVFEDLTVTLEEGERVGLVGVNGSGKSSLMRILARAAPPDTGELQLRRGTRVSYLPQEPAFPEGATVASELSVATSALRDALAAHAELSARLSEQTHEAPHRLLAELSAVSEQVERLGGWDTEHVARTLLDRLGVPDWDRPVSELSGGLRKRVAIARVLLTRPDLLLLDEPTNHLDADTVDWLEDELDALPGALLLVTHDRYFLNGLVDRIVEIQPGAGVKSFPGNYEAYLEEKLFQAEKAERAQHKRERWIAQEVAWLRRGPEARRTKSKARIERARKLMAERGHEPARVAALQTTAASRLGHTVAELRHVSHRFGERRVLENVGFLLQGGERVGLVGPNGVGKTTFLRVLLGELAPVAGEVVLGKNTRVAYYDQTREQLDLEQTVYDAAWGEDFVDIGGKRVALRDYLDDLLFPVPMQRMQVKALSGGERNRLLLARLFLQGANVLVLDEPTNDLDLVTLNVLEGLIAGFPGSVLLVTHDRYFLDKVATRILAFEGEGKVVSYAGNYDLYRRLKAQGSAPMTGTKANEVRPSTPTTGRDAPLARKAGKRSFKEQRELDGMEAAIEAAEAELAALEGELASPQAYQLKGGVAALQERIQAQRARVQQLYARWQDLSGAS